MARSRANAYRGISTFWRTTMSDPMQPGTPAPGAEGPGIFLPTLIWTTDRKTVGNEMQRLLGRRAQLNVCLLYTSDAADE